jgi:thiamine kinase-like enzyme
LVAEGDLLDDVWHRISAEEQSSVVAELVEALEKLHSVRLCDKGVKEILGKTLEEGEEFLKSFEAGVFGGPHTGFLNDGPALLDSIMERRKLKKPFYTMESIVNLQEIRIQSSFEELGSIVINNSDIEKWPGEAVLCHNDPTPRNLILQSHASSSGKSKYKLAGIIDWELAGFSPPSYELSLQDTYFLRLISGAN